MTIQPSGLLARAVSVISEADRPGRCRSRTILADRTATLQMRMKRVLLTGASGFIGHHCIGPLLPAYEVHAVSTRAAAPRSGVTWHVRPPAAGCRCRARAGGPTHLLHLAWYVVPGKLITAPDNFGWVTASLESCRAVRRARRHTSGRRGSGYEYDWNYGYCSEEADAAAPDTVYGSCKQALAPGDPVLPGRRQK